MLLTSELATTPLLAGRLGLTAARLVPAATDRLTAGSVVQQWTVQPLAVVGAAAALAWYLRAIRHRPDWARGRLLWFCTGLGLALLVCCGPAGHYARSIYWLWVAQVLTLLLIVPVPLMLGQPAALLADPPWLRRFASPLLGPALVPLIAVATLFGPVPGWAVAHAPLAWLIQLLLVAVGGLIVLPLVAIGDTASSVAVGVAVAVGFVELLIDAIPGIVLRLATHPASSFFDRRVPLAAAPAWLHDQQIGGAVLWCVAELLDLPFLVLIFRRWVRADAREAAQVDAELDARAAAEPTDGTPWFLSDPQLRDRLR